MTELMFNGVFNDLSVPQTVALLSCFVCDEKSNEMPAKTAELAGPLRKMQVYVCVKSCSLFLKSNNPKIL